MIKVTVTRKDRVLKFFVEVENKIAQKQRLYESLKDLQRSSY